MTQYIISYNICTPLYSYTQLITLIFKPNKSIVNLMVIHGRYNLVSVTCTGIIYIMPLVKVKFLY